MTALAPAPVLALDTANAHARPSKPSLLTTPSTPGPEVPGGYPRNSVVFATNKWDPSTVNNSTDGEEGAGSKGGGLLATAKSYFPANARALLPPTVASYFPESQSTNTTSSTTTTAAPSNEPSASNDTLHAPPLNTDGSVASDFSTRAFAGSRSSRATLTQGHNAHDEADHSLPSTPGASDGTGTHSSDPASVFDTSNAGDQPMSDASASTQVPSTAPVPAATAAITPEPPSTVPTTQPLPVVAPLAGASAFARTDDSRPDPQPHAHVAAADEPTPTPASPAPASDHSNSGSSLGSSLARVDTPSSAPSSPVSPIAATSPPKSTSSKFSTLSRFGGARRTRKSGDGGAPPPSTFGAARASNDSTTPADGGKLRRPHSLMRTLRGEAKVLAGRVKRDPAKVEEGRKIMSGAA